MAIEKYVGSKFNAKLSTADVAKLLRGDIKAAQKSGSLPALPVSVTTKRYSMGSSITVSVAAPNTCFNPLSDDGWAMPIGGRLTAEGLALHNKLTAMGRAYLRSEIEGASDYNNSSFHLAVSIDRA